MLRQKSRRRFLIFIYLFIFFIYFFLFYIFFFLDLGLVFDKFDQKVPKKCFWGKKNPTFLALFHQDFQKIRPY